MEYEPILALFQGFDLSLYLEARIRIRINAYGRIRIKVTSRSKIRIRIKVKGRIRIGTNVKGAIRIRINVLRIRNTGGSGSGSADPCIWLMDPDPDPAIFLIDLQDANKILICLFKRFFWLLLFEGAFPSFKR
jgi:hypothetical protein